MSIAAKQATETAHQNISVNIKLSAIYRFLPAIVLALTFAAYVGALGYQFVYDDNEQIVENHYLGSWHYAPRYFTEHVWAHQNPNAAGNYYRPIFLLWLLINRSLFGLNPSWWHLTTIAAHVAVTLMVYLLARRIAGDRLTAVAAATLFGLHPAHIEAVAWISGVTEPLMALLLISSFLCYLNKRDKAGKTWLWFAASLALYALAMLAKETALALPLIIFVYEYNDSQICLSHSHGLSRIKAIGRRLRAPARNAMPYLALTVIYLMVRAAVLKGVEHSLTPLPLLTMIFTLPSLLWFYIKSLVWPAGLSVFYDTPYISEPGLLNFFLPCFAIIAAALALWRWSRHSRAVGFASALLALPILPALNISVFYKGELAHDRYLYLPSIGFAMLAALALRRINIGSARLLKEPASQIVLMLTLVCLLNQATANQLPHWANNLSLYSRGREIAPNNFLAMNNLGVALARQGQYREAIDLYQAALEQEPLYWSATCNLGYSYYELGQLEQAEGWLNRAIAIFPHNARQFLCLGLIHSRSGRLDEAAASIRHAIELQPDGADFHYGLAGVLKKRGELTAALDECKLELAINPKHSGARDQMAEIEETVKSRGVSNPYSQKAANAQGNDRAQ
jgi:protein O-mannosyl-transferase